MTIEAPATVVIGLSVAQYLVTVLADTAEIETTLLREPSKNTDPKVGFPVVMLLARRLWEETMVVLFTTAFPVVIDKALMLCS